MPTLEALVLQAFRRACAERDLEVADRLLGAVEMLEGRRTRTPSAHADEARQGPVLEDAYSALSRIPPRGRSQ